MARALLICHRFTPTDDCDREKIQLLNSRLTPDNIVPKAPWIAQAERVVCAVFNPNRAIEVEGASIRLGAGLRAEKWAAPGDTVPDGSFALLRVDSERIELVADAVASRTLWYAQTEDTFIASSSQRAVISLLGSFAPDAQTASWMLSSGTLGPGRAWDVRLAAVPPGGRVTLHRHSWRCDVAAGPIRFDPQRLTHLEHHSRVASAVDTAVRELHCNGSRWLLPLSGGIDSRGVLLAYLRQAAPKDRISCVTWGRQSALDEPDNDAYVARQLAQHLGVDHRYFATDVSDEDRNALVSRFLVAGEGRVASITGYLDGFRIWKTFYDEGVDGIIRGDEAFGWLPIRGAFGARRSTGPTMLEDVLADSAVSSLGMAQQSIPADLQRRPGETSATWRDRLYQQFRLPVLLAALNDLKSAYVEIANPLLNASVLECVRQLPDRLRTDKRLWREIVRDWGPDIAAARGIAIVPLKGFLKDKAMLELMHEELRSDAAAAALGADCCAALLPGVQEQLAREPSKSHKRLGAVRSSMASRTRALGERIFGGRRRVDPLTLAFRGSIVSRMHTMLAEDATALRVHRIDRI
jgi:hypothetical protein